MATRYPATGIDDASTLPNPSTTNTTNNPSHAGQHANANDAIKALETKLGTGASTPAANTLLIGTGAGTSAFSAVTSAQLAATISDETGSGSVVFANTPTLITPKVDTINESTLNNGVTVAGVNIKSGLLSGANLTPGTVGSTQVATGAAVQVVNFETGLLATGTTLIPIDDTIPQNTEGDQYMSLAITPKSATNLLIIQALVFTQSNVAGNVAAALFQDSTANALATAYMGAGTSGNVPLVITHKMTAGTTSATTFKVRAGGQLAGTLTFNGLGGTRFFGGTLCSSITITEYKV